VQGAKADYTGEAKIVNASKGANDDHVDVLILYRPVQTKFGEAPGGNASFLDGFRFAN